jgi:small-conductance mechanosensitive channel
MSLAGWLATPALAQTQPGAPPPPTANLAAIVASARPDAPVMLTLANRDIVVMRASVLGRTSTDRATTAQLVVGQIVDQGGPARATMRPVDAALMFAVDGHDVFAILPADVDELAGETLEAKGQATLSRLQQALDEMTEAESPRALMRGAALSVVATAVLIVLVWVMRRADRALTRWVAATTERRLSASPELAATLLRQTRLVHYVQRAIDIVSIVIVLAVAYSWLGYTLRRFPYTRPWGDALRAFLVQQLAWIGLGVVRAIPNLVSIALIILATLFLVRLLGRVFRAVEEGTLVLPGLYPETAGPTRKLVTGFLWLGALVMAYPYIPGSSTDAFKGVSVFVGLVVSLGSTGIVNQIMSGLTVTYSRAIRAGDYVRVGDIEGTVTHLGTLSMKIETPMREDITIPNTVLIAREMTNYSRNTGATTVLATTSVTIGFDAPWRQVHSLLLMAAARTPGLLRTPEPGVFQVGLQDFYVKYVLAVSLEDPRLRFVTLAALHANIQDAFNEYGVQIMSPHYWADPQTPKVVPKGKWSPPPASDPKK